MKPTTGFLLFADFTKSAASSSAVPPISPIMITASVSGSPKKNSMQSTKLVPLMGSPPMPTQLDWPSPAAVVWATAS